MELIRFSSGLILNMDQCYAGAAITEGYRLMFVGGRELTLTDDEADLFREWLISHSELLSDA